jgi:hypothetical protein
VASSVLNGYQLRSIDGRSPKYLTAKANADKTVSTLIVGTQSGTKSLGYVVEDLASGIAIYEAAQNVGVGALILVNYGTKVTPEILARCDHISHGIVWLDNDSDHVKEQAKTIARVWNLVTAKPTYVEEDSDVDPKDISIQELEAYLRAHATWNQ